jgi:uncharacterized repeat protein (TIGR02543 family)
MDKKPNAKLLINLIVLIGLLTWGWTTPWEHVSADADTLYVKVGGTGDCTSWADACDLQTALSNAQANDEIWVAAGTYKPTTDGNRSVSFNLKSGVAIYGGFPADGGTWNQRNWEVNKTILSGDIGTPDDETDNSYHVVTATSVNDVILDGFTITQGNANGNSINDTWGGGIRISNSNLVLANLLIDQNSAQSHGGGLYNYQGNPNLTNVTFTKNIATQWGGGIFNSQGNLNLMKVAFIENSAEYGGGLYNSEGTSEIIDTTFGKNSAFSGAGLYNKLSAALTLENVTFSENDGNEGGGLTNVDSDPVLTNVTFSENTAGAGGGMLSMGASKPELKNVTFTENSTTHGGPNGAGLYNRSGGDATLVNVILWGNHPDQIQNDGNINVSYSIVEDGWSGIGNLDKDPLLLSLADNGGFTLTHALDVGSPAIDAGDDANCPTKDQRGANRPIDGDADGIAVCDIGAYEYDPNQYTLTVNISPVGAGKVIEMPQGPYVFGAKVTLTATAYSGYVFSHWSGDVDDGNKYDNPLKLSIEGNTEVTAHFIRAYTLTVNVDPDGAGSVDIDHPGPYYAGEEVTLTAVPNAGWIFSHWNDDTGNTNVVLKITITGDTVVTAHFKKVGDEGFKIYFPLINR